MNSAGTGVKPDLSQFHNNMKNRTKNPQKESLEASSGSGTSMKAAVISILVLHLAVGIGFISQGCKKENSSNSSDLVENKTKDSDTPLKTSTRTENGSSASQGMGIPSINNADQLLNPDRNKPKTNSLPPNYQSSTASSNQASPAQDYPRVAQELPLDEQSASGNTSPEVKKVPPPTVVKSNESENSFLVDDSEDLQPVSDHNGSYGNTGNTGRINNSGSASTSSNSAANSQSGSASASTTGILSANSESGFKTVTIEKGDTIGKYARENNTTVEAIQKLNPQITDLGRIQIGWKVKIPVNSTKPPGTTSSITPSPRSNENNKPAVSPGAGQGSVYEVQKGDNLYNIGVKHGIPWKEIMEFNNLKTANLNIGQKLRIPAK